MPTVSGNEHVANLRTSRFFIVSESPSWRCPGSIAAQNACYPASSAGTGMHLTQPAPSKVRRCLVVAGIASDPVGVRTAPDQNARTMTKAASLRTTAA